jgi:hypothetical protein
MENSRTVSKAVAAVLLGLVVLVSGCVSAPFVPPMGWAFSNVTAPLDVDYSKTAVPAKQGTSSAICVLGIVAAGDASTQAAARSGGIATIDHADYSYLNVLGIFHKTTVIVYGN